MRMPSLSLEALIGLFVGLFVGLVEMNWELRSLGVAFTAMLAVHIAKRLDGSLIRRTVVALGAIALLVIGTWHPIWISFHDDFPGVTGEAVLSRIIMCGALAACAAAGYFFLIRPRGKEGYQVLPAQLIAFGAIVMVAGFVPVTIGLVWQFQQNLAAGIKPTGAPVFSLVAPQITQAAPPLALPSPTPAPTTPFYSDYDLTEAGVNALADELYKIRDVLKNKSILIG